MSVEAIVCTISTRPHPKADRLLLGTCVGHQVIVSTNIKDKAIGVFVPPDSQLSHEMCMENKLYRKHPETDEPMGGYFDSNRRVRAQKLRGLYSEGIWFPIENLAWTGVDVKTLKIGDTFTSINGQLICNKYYTPATLNRIKSNKQRKSRDIPAFKEHFETKNIRYGLGSVVPGSVVYVTSKIHGTSGRTGLLKETKKFTGLKGLWNKYLSGLTGLKYTEESYVYVTGTRRTVIDTSSENVEKIRLEAHNKLVDRGLKKGETIYYELAGFDENGSPIMSDHKIEDNDVKKIYNSNIMRYSYGCEPTECKMFVYRITQTNEDEKSVIELSWQQVKSRCNELGLQFVPEFDSFIFNGDEKQLLASGTKYVDGPDVLDSSHTREGVCFRIENQSHFDILKWKSAIFSDLEGIKKNDSLYVDREEVA